MESLARMDSLAKLSPASGPGMCIPVRVVFTVAKEITPKASGKKFHMLQFYIVDAAGHYSIVQRRIFGDDAQRQRTIAEMRKKFFDSSAWLMSKISSVEKNSVMYTCISVPYVINFDPPRSNVQFTAQMVSSEVAKTLPKIIEPRECLRDLTRIADKRMVNLMGLLVDVEVPANMQQPMVKATVADWSGRIHVKFWGSQWMPILKGKEGQVICGFGLWASKADSDLEQSQSASLRALSSVDSTYVAWPTVDEMPEKGKGKRLLAEKGDILTSMQSFLTEDGYNAERENYEAAEACATVAVLMELATRYLHPLPDTLFQIQGAYVTVTARGSDGLCTKDPPPL